MERIAAHKNESWKMQGGVERTKESLGDTEEDVAMRIIDKKNKRPNLMRSGEQVAEDV